MKKTYHFHLCILLLSCFFFTSCSSDRPPEWKQLFNGKDLKDWKVKIREHPVGENFDNTFRVVDGHIQNNYDQYNDKFKERFGHLFYKKTFSYYLLGVEYRFKGDQIKDGPGWAFRNNGIMIHGQVPETMTLNQDFPNSIEVQLLGGDGTGERSTANVCTPGTQYVRNGEVVTAHCVNSSSKTYNGEQWVRVDVLALGDSLIVHYVNGNEVLRYERPQLDPKDGAKEGKLLDGGTISLQSESAPTQFRKVEIIDLEKYRDNPKKLQQIVEKHLAGAKKILQNQ